MAAKKKSPSRRERIDTGSNTLFVRRNERGTSFKKVVDGATAALYTSGEGLKLYDKWFMQKIPPKGLNLNAPIGPELKHEFAKPSDSPDPDSYKAM